MRSEISLFVMTALLGGTHCSYAFSDDCSHPATPGTYRAESSDHADARSLDASRNFAEIRNLTIDICQGELHVEGTRSSSIRLEVTSDGTEQDLSQYLHDFSAGHGMAKVDIRVPSKYHPVIKVYVPAQKDLKSEINLGAGHMFFYGDRIPGARELNVGAGKVVLYLDLDHDYSSLEANIGMGALHDDCPGGHDAHFVVARSMPGSGSGNLKVNVGAGQIDLEPDKN